MLAVVYCYLVTVYARLTLHSLQFADSVGWLQQHPSFSPPTYFDDETLYLVQCFSTVFGIWPIFEMHRGM